MKRKTWLIALVVLLPLLVCAWLWLRSRTPSTSVAPLEKDSPVSVTTPLDSNRVSVPDSPSVVELEKRKEQAISAAFLTPIAIFGKVIDEHQRSVQDATVEISINDSPVRSGTEYVRSTDADGLFSLTGVHGISFSLRASKNGFYTTKESTAHRNVIAPGSTDAAIPTRETPITLTLRSQGHPEVLIHVTSRQVNVPPTGEVIIFDLRTGRVGTGELQIASRLGDSTQPRFDWSYQLSVPEGGLAERRGQFDFEAPSDGYVQHVQISMSSTDGGWSSDVAKEYFARLSDGRFARFSINVYPGKRNFVVIESYVNSTPGNRNLEFGGEMPLSR